jgi:hypothetical protein
VIWTYGFSSDCATIERVTSITRGGQKKRIPEHSVITVALTLHRLPICQPGAPGSQSTHFSSLHPKSIRISDLKAKQQHVRKMHRVRKYCQVDLIKSEIHSAGLSDTNVYSARMWIKRHLLAQA